MNLKQEYRRFTKGDVPLFFKDYWWDTLHADWDVVHAELNGIKAWMPWFHEKHFGFNLIRNPRLTPYSGIICEKNCSEKVQKELLALLIDQLPKVAQIDVDLFPFGNSLSTEDSKRTHYLSLDKAQADIYDGFKSSLKRQIKKAAKSLKVEKSQDANLLFEMYSKTFEKRAQSKFLKREWLEPMWQIGQEKQCTELLIAVDENSNVHSALWIAYDKNYSYYLLGGSDPEHLGSGAMGLLLWTAIQAAHERGNKLFDFEGSEIEGIARFFKTFGAIEQKVPVLKINYSPSFKLLQKIKSRL